MPTNLISPGTSVTVTNQTFYIPSNAPSVPLVFIATGESKLQPDGTSPAIGTYESDVVRTVSSINDLLQLYGIPVFQDTTVMDPITNVSSTASAHGDARNEYGLLALAETLGVIAEAYVIRANVSVDDNINSIRTLWDTKIGTAAQLLLNSINTYINNYNTSNNLAIGSAAVSGYEEFGIVGSQIIPTNLLGLDKTIWYGFSISIDSAPAIDVVLYPTPVSDAYWYDATNNPTGVQGVAGAATGSTGYTNVVGTTGDPTTATSGQFQGMVTSTTTGFTSTMALYAPSSEQITSLNTYGDFISALNTLLAGTAVAAIVNGRLRITSGTSGDLSSVQITDYNAFSQMGINSTYAGQLYSTVPGSAGYKTTVMESELISLLPAALTGVVSSYSFRNVYNDLVDLHTTAYDIYANGYNAIPSGTGTTGFVGVTGYLTANGPNFTAVQAQTMLQAMADQYKFTLQFRNQTSLGANDAAKRSTIITALNAAINNNSEIRSENFEYNVIACPGYFEVIPALTALSIYIGEEAFVVADTPMTMEPSAVVAWGQTSAKIDSANVAYWYPHLLTTNLDGTTVVGAASGAALRAIGYTDNNGNLWDAPAGIPFGLVTGVNEIGYISGTPGTATQFIPTHLNPGQRNNLYNYGTDINPIAFLKGAGFVILGQKTSFGSANDLDRINNSRLVMYIKRQVKMIGLPFLFKRSNSHMWGNMTAACTNFLSSLTLRGALYDFAVICNASNNTPQDIDEHRLNIDIALQPEQDAEFIYFTLNLVPTGSK